MKGTMFKSGVGILFILLAAGVLIPDEAAAQTFPSGLDLNYYAVSCPLATLVIKSLTYIEVFSNRIRAPQLLRLHFHDCFVRGCDASVLIYKSNLTGERDAFPNVNSLQGYDFIDYLKGIMELLCPKTISCADILALAARDAVEALDDFNGPFGNIYWDVPLGRKDGNYSFATEANSNLPAPFLTYDQLVQNFANKGLNQTQMVTLSGAHTIGTANCTNVNTRIYNFTGHGDADPTLNSSYVPILKSECPAGTITTRIPMKQQTGTTSTNYTFDPYYYDNLLTHKGLFPSDGALITNGTGLGFVQGFANSSNQNFVSQFNAAMVAMGQIGVTTVGQVRTNCSSYLYT